jgi:hypothetical protein
MAARKQLHEPFHEAPDSRSQARHPPPLNASQTSTASPLKSAQDLPDRVRTHFARAIEPADKNRASSILFFPLCGAFPLFHRYNSANRITTPSANDSHEMESHETNQFSSLRPRVLL